MAQTIKIKRSTSTAAPTSLSAGELAYSSNSNKLFVGHPGSSAVTAIGGALYVNMLDHTAGTLTASSAVVVDVIVVESEWDVIPHSSSSRRSRRRCRAASQAARPFISRRDPWPP